VRHRQSIEAKLGAGTGLIIAQAADAPEGSKGSFLDRRDREKNLSRHGPLREQARTGWWLLAEICRTSSGELPAGPRSRSRCRSRRAGALSLRSERSPSQGVRPSQVDRSGLRYLAGTDGSVPLRLRLGCPLDPARHPLGPGRRRPKLAAPVSTAPPDPGSAVGEFGGRFSPWLKPQAARPAGQIDGRVIAPGPHSSGESLCANWTPRPLPGRLEGRS